MKKLLLPLTITGILLLGACGNDEAEKKDDSKKSESVEKKKDTAKKDDSKKDTAKKDNESTEQTEQVATDEPNTQKQQSQEVAQQEQPTEQPVQQEPTDQEKAEANAKVAKENGYTGIPNGDAHSDVPVGQIELPPDELAKEEAKPEYQDVVEPEEPSEWVKGQDEWMNASEAEREEIRKADAEKYGYEYDPADYE